MIVVRGLLVKLVSLKRLETRGCRKCVMIITRPTVWYSLPSDVTSNDSLSVLRRRLKFFGSAARIQVLFYDCTFSFRRDLEAFYIATGHVNLIGDRIELQLSL